jgi:hypothetical protein
VSKFLNKILFFSLVMTVKLILWCVVFRADWDWDGVVSGPLIDYSYLAIDKLFKIIESFSLILLQTLSFL